jgi:hypothetical protein
MAPLPSMDLNLVVARTLPVSIFGGFAGWVERDENHHGLSRTARPMMGFAALHPSYADFARGAKMAIFPKPRPGPSGLLSPRSNSRGEAQMPNTKSSDLIALLHADGPAPEHAEALKLYGQFIGDWETDIVAHAPDGVRHQGQGEIHFGWILEGRAVQDVWMIPRRHERRPDAPVMPIAGNWYGTTIRAYDPVIDAWRIWWIDPARGAYYQQIGRRQDADIVQEGTTEAGALSRWSFTEITPDSFHWKGEASFDNGASWRLLVEVFARRAENPAERR